jgi:acetyl esterase/lipase
MVRRNIYGVTCFRAMPSVRARVTIAILRLTTKRRWRSDTPVVSVRERARRMDTRIGRRLGPDRAEPVVLAGVPCKWYGPPASTASGTLLFLHGGAWCMHLPNLYRRFVLRLSGRTGLRILLPDYRLAPEHVFPAGVDDCFAVYRELVGSSARVKPLFLGGDSAGGGLTAVTLMRARDAGLALPDAAVLLSPALDLTMSGASYGYNERLDAMFSAAATRLLPNVYCPGQDLRHPWISPLFADWRGLPPLLFHVGSTEMLHDDSVHARERATVAGVEARLRIWPGMPHVFQLFEWLPEATLALDDIAAFLRERGAANRPGAATMHAGEQSPSTIPQSHARSGA